MTYRMDLGQVREQPIQSYPKHKLFERVKKQIA